MIEKAGLLTSFREIFFSSLLIGSAMSSLIILFSNDSLTGPGMILLVCELVFFYFIPLSLMIVPLVLVWRTIHGWPRLLWLVPLSLLPTVWVYIWNLYVFRQFLRGSQIFLIGGLVLLFVTGIIILGLFLQRDPGKILSTKRSIIIVILVLFPLGAANVVPSLTHVEPLNDEPPLERTIPIAVDVFGIDGGDWDILWPMIRMGKTGCLEHFVNRGSRFPLRTFDPTSSPLIWTSISTGLHPFQHGIRDFGSYRINFSDAWISVLPKGAGFLKISGLMKKAGLWQFVPSSADNIHGQPIWQILSQAGLTVSVNNWPVSVPVSQVRGDMKGETEYLMHHSIRPENTVFPGFFEETWNWQSDETSKQNKDLNSIVNRDLDLAELMSSQLKSQWVESRYRKSKYPASFTFIYTHSLDLIQHLFWRFGFKLEENMTDSASLSPFRQIENHIKTIDRELALFYEKSPQQSYTILLSDHGFRDINYLEKYTNPQSGRVHGVHDYSPKGFFLVTGPGIRQNEPGDAISVFDVMPTLLHLAGLPKADNMMGTSFLQRMVYPEQFVRFSRDVDTIASYGSASHQRSRKSKNMGDEQIEDKLKSLGYIE